MMKVVVDLYHDGSSQFVETLRSTFPAVTFEGVRSRKEQKQAIQDAEVYYGFLAPDVYAAAKNLRWVQLPGSGIDMLLELPGMVENDIIITNARGPHVNAMADHVIGMMVILAHNWMEHFDTQRAHRWERGDALERQIEISGSSMGILGLGDVGRGVARRAQAFGIDVYAVDKYPVPDPAVREVWGLERLDDLLRESDWFVVAAPLTPGTRGLIDARKVSMLKEGARVIVISRGGIVDDAALIGGLQSGHIAGVGLDVLAQEPPPKDSPLWDMPNVVLTPHCSCDTTEILGNVEQIFKENLRRYLAGEPFLYVPDKAEGF